MIKDLFSKELIEYDYDQFYREFCLKLKGINESQREEITSEFLKRLPKSDIKIDNIKREFMDILMDENSAKYLWILYNNNLLNDVSEIFKKSNEVTRGGVNTYKILGWMVHVIYVYQIVNYNIANNIKLKNYNNNMQKAKNIKELHQMYNNMEYTSKFILKIFTLIHDIGVINEVANHDIHGVKYVEQIINDIGINDKTLLKYKIDINTEDLIKTLKLMIREHVLINRLSGEASDLYVKERYGNILKELEDVNIEKEDIASILTLLGFADLIAVDESLLNDAKYNRIINTYNFFLDITNQKESNRDKTKVAIERFCDMLGTEDFEKTKIEVEKILSNLNIDSNIFWNDLYNIRLFDYTGPLMKYINNLSYSVKILYRIIELAKNRLGEDVLSRVLINFNPKSSDSEFKKQIEQGMFFECIEQLKNSDKYIQKNENVKIEIKHEERYISINIQCI